MPSHFRLKVHVVYKVCVGGGGLYVPEGEGERGREVGRVRGRGKVRESEKVRMCTYVEHW